MSKQEEDTVVNDGIAKEVSQEIQVGGIDYTTRKMFQREIQLLKQNTIGGKDKPDIGRR